MASKKSSGGVNDSQIREFLTLYTLKADIQDGVKGIEKSDEALKQYAEHVGQVEKEIQGALKGMNAETRKSAKTQAAAYMSARRAAAQEARAKQREAEQHAKELERLRKEKERAEKAAQREAEKNRKAAEREQKALNRAAEKEAARHAKAMRTAGAGGAGGGALPPGGTCAGSRRAAGPRGYGANTYGSVVGTYFASQAFQGVRSLIYGWKNAFDQAIQDTADRADKALVDSKRLSMTTGSTQAVMYANEIAGTEWNEVMTGIRGMADNIRDSLRGKGSAKAALQEMGLMGEIRAGKLDDVFTALMRVERVFSKATEAQKQNWLAQLFKHTGSKMLPLLDPRVGGMGLQNVILEAQRLGLIISDNLVAASQAFNDELTRSRGLVQGIQNAILEKALPIITSWRKAWRTVLENNRHDIAIQLQPIVDYAYRIAFAFGIVGERTDRLMNQTGGWGANLRRATQAAMALSGALGTIFASIGMVAGARGLRAIGSFLNISGFRSALLVLGKPLLILGAIVAALAAVALAFDDIMTFFRGGKSIFGEWLEWLFGLVLTSDQAKEAVDGYREALKGAWALITATGEFLWQSVLTGFAKLVDMINWIWRKITGGDFFEFDFAAGDMLSNLGENLTYRAAMMREGSNTLRDWRGAPASVQGGDSSYQQTNNFYNHPNPSAAPALLEVAGRAHQSRAQR